MLEIRITITSPDLSAAIERLAAAMGAGAQVHTTTPTPFPPVAEPEASKAPEAPEKPEEPEPEREMPATPENPTPDEPKTITLQMLSEAGAKLLDQGKMADVIAALGKYGVPSLTALKPEHYQDLADDFRIMGVEV